MEENHKIYGVFTACFILFSIIQFSTKGIIGTDGFFHIKYAELILSHGIMRDFQWWAFSNYADTHFLYHVLLIPFLVFGNYAAKVSAVFLGATLFTVIYWILKKYKVEYSHFWVLALFAFGSDALFRYNTPRAFVLGLILMLIGFYFLIEKKYKPLAILMFIFAWTYTSYIILLGFIFLYGLYKWFIFGDRDLSALKYGFLGGVLGTVINPFFPDNLNTIYIQVFQVLIEKPNLLLLSVDAQPYPSVIYFVKIFLGVFILFVIGCYMYFKNKEYKNEIASLFFIGSLTGLVLSFRAMRFVEYFAPFTIIFAAIIISPLIKKFTDKVIDFKDFKLNLTSKKINALFLIILIPATIVSISTMGKIATAATKDIDGYLPCSRWLEMNTNENEIILNYWHEFPMFFYYNTKNRYVTGLDPTYFYNYDEKLYRRYENVLLIKTNQTVELMNELNTNYAVLGTQTNKFKTYFGAFNDLEIAFETPKCTVFKLK